MLWQYRPLWRRLLRTLRSHPRLVTLASIAFSLAAVGVAVVGARGRGVASAVAVVLMLIGVALSVLGWWMTRPRGLGAVPRRVLIETLGRLAPLDVKVSAVDEPEAIRYARELTAVLIDAHWTVTGVFKCPYDGNGAGVALAVRNVLAPPTEAITLVNTLRRVGVRATWEHKPSLPEDRTIEVLVRRLR
jgi:hypothetical protein